MGNLNELVEAARAATIPAPALRAVTLAQWLLESARGTSDLARIHNNYAGLKWRSEMEGHATKVRYQAHDGAADYCAFASPAAFIAGYWRFIGRSVYDGWRTYQEDEPGYVCFLKCKGYAGDPHYLKKVLGLIPEAERLLNAPAVPRTPASPARDDVLDVDRPSRPELGETLDDLLGPGDEPDFHTLPGVQHKLVGKRPNGLEGAIVHFDAGRSRPVRGPDDPHWGGRATSEYGETSGFTYVTIARSGRVFLPANMDWTRWGSHAGTSLCPATKRAAVSQYYVGIEVNSPGLLHPTEDADVFVPWFDAVRDARGNVVVDTKGRAKVKNPNGELYRRAQLRHVATQKGNIRPGAYVPYTAEQMEALTKLLLWLKRRYVATFRLDRVFGHDEVSPGRKADPGGSLGQPGGEALTMSQYRSQLLKLWADQTADL